MKGALIVGLAIGALFVFAGMQRAPETSANTTNPPPNPPPGIPSEIDLNRIRAGDFGYWLDVITRYGPQVVAEINKWWKAVDPAGFNRAQPV